MRRAADRGSRPCARRESRTTDRARRTRACSTRFPAPTIRRPPLIASTLARWLASQTGLCCGTTSTLVPRRTRVVTAAAQLSVANGSRRNGDGYVCSAGCTMWSLTQTSRKPRSSALPRGARHCVAARDPSVLGQVDSVGSSPSLDPARRRSRNAPPAGWEPRELGSSS